MTNILDLSEDIAYFEKQLEVALKCKSPAASYNVAKRLQLLKDAQVIYMRNRE
jgi:hypothetical protein